MINPEWAKNMSSLLSQAKELSEKNPSFEKVLEFANNAAKQFKNTASNPNTPSYSEDDPKDDGTSAGTSTLNATVIMIKKIDELISALGKLLEMADSTAKQISAMEPILPTFLKGQTKTGNLCNSSFDGKQISHGNANGFKILTYLLLIIILPFLLMNFTFRFR